MVISGAVQAVADVDGRCAEASAALVARFIARRAMLTERLDQAPVLVKVAVGAFAGERDARRRSRRAGAGRPRDVRQLKSSKLDFPNIPHG